LGAFFLWTPFSGLVNTLSSSQDVRDVAAMLASALGKGLSNEILNSVSSRAITFSGMVKMCEKATGKTANVVWYDPEAIAKSVDGFQVKKAFPFRPRHFFADPCGNPKVMNELGWDAVYTGSQESLQVAIESEYATYLELGLDQKQLDFAADDKILACVGRLTPAAGR
jgi:nucleoside-diphosphate-sugar epimerase